MDNFDSHFWTSNEIASLKLVDSIAPKIGEIPDNTANAVEEPAELEQRLRQGAIAAFGEAAACIAPSDQLGTWARFFERRRLSKRDYDIAQVDFDDVVVRSFVRAIIADYFDPIEHLKSGISALDDNAVQSALRSAYQRFILEFSKGFSQYLA